MMTHINLLKYNQVGLGRESFHVDSSPLLLVYLKTKTNNIHT